MTTSDGNPPHGPHCLFFRPSEVCLLYDLVLDSMSPDPAWLEENLAPALQTALQAQPPAALAFHPDNPFTGQDGRARAPVLLSDGAGGWRVLQTVNLASWIPTTEREDLTSRHDVGEDPAICSRFSQQLTDVANAVKGFSPSEQEARLELPGPEGKPLAALQLAALSPNWLATLF